MAAGKTLQTSVEKFAKKFGDEQSWDEAAKELIRRAAKEPTRTVAGFVPVVPAVQSPGSLASVSGETLLDSKEAAKVLDCCVTTVQRYSRCGLLPYVPFGKRRRYRRKSLLGLKEIPALKTRAVRRKRGS
jgi:hypothetical protein